MAKKKPLARRRAAEQKMTRAQARTNKRLRSGSARVMKGMKIQQREEMKPMELQIPKRKPKPKPKRKRSRHAVTKTSA